MNYTVATAHAITGGASSGTNDHPRLNDGKRRTDVGPIRFISPCTIEADSPREAAVKRSLMLADTPANMFGVARVHVGASPTNVAELPIAGVFAWFLHPKRGHVSVREIKDFLHEQ